MHVSRVELAVLNNVRWYEVMFAAHGLTSDVNGRAWRSHQKAPPFHSNLVVLSPGTSQAEVEAHVAELGRQPLAAGWTLKDSYANLDLSALGFEVLFDAEWIWRDPRRAAAGQAVPGFIWDRVETAPALSQWEQAWLGDARNDAPGGLTRQFPDPLLASPDHAFFAGRIDGRIVAGGIINRSPGVVGLSNVFSPDDLAEAAWNALVGCASADFPDTPVVGYERGADLQIALRVGFSAIGGLRVWCRAG